MLYIVSGFNLHQKARQLAVRVWKESDSIVTFFPENEIHPIEQSNLGASFITEFPDQDIYVVTFRDHILNGARLKATQTDTPFKAIFYDKDGEATELDFNRYGVCSVQYPDGFFDQTLNDLSSILSFNLEKRKNKMS